MTCDESCLGCDFCNEPDLDFECISCGKTTKWKDGCNTCIMCDRCLENEM